MNPSKREFIQLFCSIYDSLGLISPFVVSFKYLFQQVRLSKTYWDAVLMNEVLQEWRKMQPNLLNYRHVLRNEISNLVNFIDFWQWSFLNNFNLSCSSVMLYSWSNQIFLSNLLHNKPRCLGKDTLWNISLDGVFMKY